MKYFLHDSNAFQDEKITELYMNFGYEGVGLFFTVLEKLSLQEKPIKTIVLKKQLNVGKKLEKCWNFMESLDILSSNNGETFNKQLLNFSEKYMIKKEKNKERIANWRSNNEKEKNVTCYKSVRNTPKDKISKVKISKVKESKVKLNTSEPSSQTNKDISEVIKMFEIVNPSFEKFYGNTTQRSACERLLKKWSIPQIKVLVNLLPEFNAREYQKGKSITPLQMEDNLAYIKTFIDSKRQVNSKVAIIS
jgi:hypothetical protein